jgi:hypothetical protein
MENVNNSCLMLAANLVTPVSLQAVFDTGDLKDTGIVIDSHLTILFSRAHLDLKRETLEQFPSYLKLCAELKKDKESGENYAVYELFELGSFENESGYVVLKLKTDNKWFELLGNLNDDLMKHFDITSDFGDYKPHLSLAEVEPGLTGKYVNSETLDLVLKSSLVYFEDIVASYDFGDEDSYKRFNLTNNFNVDRFFRERELKNETIEE